MGGGGSAAGPTPMEQDGEQAPADDLDQLMNDPAVFQQIIDELPGTEEKVR